MVTLEVSDAEEAWLARLADAPDQVQCRRLQVQCRRLTASTFQCVLTEATAGVLRERCADALQSVGFDEKYSHTDDGWILESLIDKLFLG